MITGPVSVRNDEHWNQMLAGFAGTHLLQSWQWGEFKARYGWRAQRAAWYGEGREVLAAAQILGRDVRLPGIPAHSTLLYCPRGPLLDWSDADLHRRILRDLAAIAVQQRAFLLKLDPEVVLGYGPAESSTDSSTLPGETVASSLRDEGWRPSRDQIQFRNTLMLDLQPSEDDLLAGMKQKTRYNVRLATRRGVKARRGDLKDLDLLYKMYAETSIRDDFSIRKRDYYLDLWSSFLEAGMAQPFVAEVNGEPVAGLVVFKFGATAWYLHGMSRAVHREKMPNHLLQWEAIRWAKQAGCTRYDFWGAPDELNRGDRMWGVYRFKEGFGATFVRTVGAWDYPVRPALYWLYTLLAGHLLGWMRARGRIQTLQTIE